MCRTAEEIRLYINKWKRDKRKELGKREAYMDRHNLVGKKFNRLTVLSKLGHKGHHTLWLCKCDCGKLKEVCGGELKNGKVKSCGCLRIEKSKIGTHYDSHSKEYNTWSRMIGRCYTKTVKMFPMYGGRGILVCERWLHSYENFLADMGRCPSKKMSLDRIDNNGNYEPSNCRWATYETQANNRRSNHFITYKGETLTISQWAKKLNIGRWTFHNLKYRNCPEKIFEFFYKKAV